MNKLEANSLLDFYGVPLTEKQQQITEYYFREDYSLQEIAEITNVSRSAVHDTIRRCEKELQAYEDKLHLGAQFRNARKILEDLSEEIREAGDIPEEKRGQLMASVRELQETIG